jgi:hypothetical protein
MMMLQQAATPYGHAQSRVKQVQQSQGSVGCFILLVSDKTASCRLSGY